MGDDGVAEVDVYVDSPEIWYPYGYGAKPLFEVTAELTVGNFCAQEN